MPSAMIEQTVFGFTVGSKNLMATELILSKGGSQVISSRLRQLIMNGEADPSALEIVVYRIREGVQND